MVVSNGAPFTPVVRIYPGSDPSDARTWTTNRVDISPWIRYPGGDGGQPISYSAGRTDEASRVDASKMDLTLDNRDGRFSSRNPTGPYYPNLKRGTPITLSMVTSEDNFNRVAANINATVLSGGGGVTWANAGSTWSINGTSAVGNPPVNTFSFVRAVGAGTFNGEGRVTISSVQTITGTEGYLGGVYFRASGATGAVCMLLEFTTTGQVQLTARYKETGFNGIGAATSIPYTAGDKIRMYWVADGANLRGKFWKPANPALPDADEPADWSLVTSYSRSYGGQIGMMSWRTAGNTNTGNTLLYDDWVTEAAEFTGAISQLPVEWNVTGSNSWAAISAAGPLRRLQQGSGQLKSPLARQLPAYKPLAYWPLEDGSQATQFGSATNAVQPAFKSGGMVQAAGDSSLPGGGPAPTFLTNNASIRGQAPRRQAGSGFAALFFFKLAALPATKTKVVQFQGSGRITTWNWYIDSGSNTTVEGIEADGTVTINVINNSGGVDFTKWVALQLETERIVATNTVEWAWTFLQVGNPAFYSQAGSFTSTQQCRVWLFQVGSSASDLSGMAVAHMWLGENTLPFVDYTFNAVSDGYRGELASARELRLATDENLALMVEPGTSEALGPQRPGSFLDNLQDAADSDNAILYEAGSGLGFRPRSARYNRPVHMALSVAAGQIAKPPRPIDDDQRLRNDWTVSRDEGAFAQVTDPISIAGNGKYADSITINTQTDSPLPDHAGWRTYLGTRDDLRWPDITLNFARSPELLELWRSAPYGFRFTVATGRSQLPGSDPDVIAEGFTGTFWPHGWEVVLNCSSAWPWDVAALDSVNARLDQDAGVSTIGAVNSITNTLTVTTQAGNPLWTLANFPFGAMIGGERMTVTNITGATSPQTFTVTRSVNNVVKSHLAGTSVQVYRPFVLSH